jgi:hypothetical protein
MVLIKAKKHSKSSFNFFPKNIERERTIRRSIYYAVAALLVFNIGFVSYNLFLSNLVRVINETKLDHTMKIAEADPIIKLDATIKGYEADLAKITAYQKSINSVEAPMFAILVDLEKLVPSNITFNSLTLGEDGKIVLIGLAKDEYEICDFVTSLKGMSKISDVYLKSTSKKEDDQKKDGNYANIFNIECQVQGLTKIEGSKTTK